MSPVSARASHHTAETQLVETAGVEFACRRFGTPADQSPTLVIQGDNDLMILTELSHLMAGLIPDAQIRIYPDAAYGFLFPYPTEVATEVNAFLAR